MLSTCFLDSVVHKLHSVPYLPCVVCGAAAVSVLTVTVYYVKKQRAVRERAERRAAYPRDTVILHQIPRGPFAPSLSPYPIKLETFLRVAKVPYQNEIGLEMSSKGKTPWITINDRDISDSELSIIEIKEHFNVDIEDHLSPEQQAQAHILKRWADEAFIWDLLMIRWIHEFESQIDFLLASHAVLGMSDFLLKRILKSISKQCSANAHAQGIGRHSVDEIQTFISKDLRAFSLYLGDKQYMLGARPTEADCAVFGMLAQVKWHGPGTSVERKFKEYPNLDAYCDRMKQNYWPDWDQCNTAGGTKQAEK